MSVGQMANVLRRGGGKALLGMLALLQLSAAGELKAPKDRARGADLTVG